MARKAAAQAVVPEVMDTALVPFKSALQLLNEQLAELRSPRQVALEQEARALVTELESLRVNSEADRDRVLEKCREAKRVEAQLEERFQPFVDAANSLHKGFLKWRDSTEGASLDALDNERRAAQKRAGAWEQQDRERKRQQQLAEQAERERQAEIARQLEAEELRAAGADEAAEELVAAPLAVAAPVPVESRTVAETPYVPKWTYRIDKTAAEQLLEIAALLQRNALSPDAASTAIQLATGLERLAAYVVLDQQRVGATVRALKGDARIPGVTVYDEGDYRVRG